MIADPDGLLAHSRGSMRVTERLVCSSSEYQNSRVETRGLSLPEHAGIHGGGFPGSIGIDAFNHLRSETFPRQKTVAVVIEPAGVVSKNVCGL
jgi:hypothetical protein